MSSLVGIHTSVYANSVAIQGIGGVDTLAFYAPLTSSLTLSAGTATPTFTRATVATVTGGNIVYDTGHRHVSPPSRPCVPSGRAV